MSVQDILNQASVAFPMWDGSDPRCATNYGNNTTSCNAIRIVNSYEQTSTIDPRHPAQLLVVGPLPENISSPTFALAVAQILFVDTSSGAVAVTMPPNPYQGMKVGLKDSTGSYNTHALTVHGNTGDIEQHSAPGTWAASDVISEKGRFIEYTWDAGTGHWDITGMY